MSPVAARDPYGSADDYRKIREQHGVKAPLAGLPSADDDPRKR